jgi:chromosome segregation ATPase
VVGAKAVAAKVGSGQLGVVVPTVEQALFNEEFQSPRFRNQKIWCRLQRMALKSTYDAVEQAIQDLIAPDLERIKGEIAVLKGQIAALDVKMEAKFGASDTKFGALDTKFGALDTKIEALGIKIEGVRGELRCLEKRLDETLNIRERLAAIEAALRAGQHA